MGRLENGQGQFFYSFDLDEVVPPDHLVRQIARFAGSELGPQGVAPYYSHTGRPSIDPVLMIRMLLVGYVFAIRSERRICAKFRSTLPIAGSASSVSKTKYPTTPVFCRARQEALPTERCPTPGVRGCGGDEHCGRAGWGRGVLDRCEPDQGRCGTRRNGYRATSRTGPVAFHAVREYLAALDTARGDEDRGGDDGSGEGGQRRKPPKQVSLTDPQATWVARPGLDPFFAYDQTT